jgi:hypothetical protein
MLGLNISTLNNDMPYKRVGKCVYLKKTGKKVGCSNSVEKAKKYLKALHINVEDEEKKETFIETYNQLIQRYGN